MNNSFIVSHTPTGSNIGDDIINNKGVEPFPYILSGRSRQRKLEIYNRTPHLTDMKYTVARGPPANKIIGRRGVNDVPLVFENCRDFQTGQAKNTFAICNAILR